MVDLPDVTIASVHFTRVSNSVVAEDRGAHQLSDYSRVASSSRPPPRTSRYTANMDYHELGRSAYKRKDFEQALQYFNRAFARGESAKLLDNRAACHERLGDLPAALKDAKRTINSYKLDPTGYLRAGRILVKMDKRNVALDIYAYGLKTVKPEGDGFKVCLECYSLFILRGLASGC